MNSTYTLNEGNEALNRVLLMMRYDLGKTLSENIVLEQKTITNKDIEKFKRDDFENQTRKYVDKTSVSFKGPDGKKISTATSPKMLRELPSKTMTLDEFMENYRDALTHPVMVGLEVALTSTGVGVGAVVATYTALLAYDVYKGVVKKDWDWLNIVFDILGIVSSGVLSATLRPIMQGAKSLKFKNFREVLTYLTKTNKWYEIESYLKTGLSLLKSISKGIEEILLWISKKTGFKSIEYAGVAVETWIQKLVYDLQDFLKKSVKKTVKFLEPGANVTTKKAITRGVVAGSLSKAIDYLSKYADVEIPKWNNNNLDKNKWNTFIIANNPKIYGKNIKYSEKIGEILFSFLRDVNGNFYIYDTDTKKWVKQTDPKTKEEIHKMFFINNAYSKEKLSDFEVNDSDKKRPIFTINGVDYKFADNNYRLKKI